MGDVIDVKITEVLSPDKYLAVKSNVDDEEIKQLEAELLIFFHNKEDEYSHVHVISKHDMVIYHDVDGRRCYRGRVDHVLIRSSGLAYYVFLVDNGKRVLTTRNCIRRLQNKFCHLPFNACCLSLPNLCPLSLDLKIGNENITANHRKAKNWDEAAFVFARKLTTETTHYAKAEILEWRSPLDCVVILHIRDGVNLISMNKLLVVEKFAVLEEEEAEGTIGLESHFENIKLDNKALTSSPVACGIFSALNESKFNTPRRLDDSSASDEYRKVSPKSTIEKHNDKTQEEYFYNKSNITEKCCRSDTSCSSKEEAQPIERCNSVSSCVSKADSLASFLAKVKTKSQRPNLMKENLCSPKSSVNDGKLQYEKITSHSRINILQEKFNKVNITPKKDCKSVTTDKARDYVNLNTFRIIFGLKKTNKKFISPLQNIAARKLRYFNVEFIETDQVFKFGEYVPASMWKNLNTANIHKHLLQRMQSENMRPTGIQCYSWPAIARGIDVVLINPPNSKKEDSYLIPLLSSVLFPETYKSLPVGNGPLLLIMCANCKSANNVFQRCNRLLEGYGNLKLCLLHTLPLPETSKAELVNGCDVLVTLPDVFMNVMMESKGEIINVNRLCHLVIDDADILLEDNVQTIKNFAASHRKASRHLRNVPQQHVVCGEKWLPGIESFFLLMSSPVVYMSCLLEACVFTKMRIIPSMCTTVNKDDVLIQTLKNIQASRIVIFATSRRSVEHVKALLQNQSYFAYSAHSDMTKSDLLCVYRNWISQLPPNSHLIFVMSDDVYPDVPITDAKVLIHFEYCENKQKFRSRFGVLMKQLSSDVSLHEGGLSKKITVNCNSYMMITEKDELQANFLYRYLMRIGEREIPMKLAEMIEKYKMSKADPTKPLCSSLKAFGFCKTPKCTKRHNIVEDSDKVELPVTGSIKLKITYVVSANHYYARLISVKSESKTEKFHNRSAEIAIRLGLFFSNPSNCEPLECVEEGTVGSIRGDNAIYYRVKVLDITNRAYCKVFYVDSGKTEEVQVNRIFQLPEELSKYEPQVSEIILSGLQPPDKNSEWLSFANMIVREKILDEKLDGSIIASLGNTLWLSTLQKVSYLETVGLVSRDFEVRDMLLKKKLAIENPDHLKNVWSTRIEKSSFLAKSLNDSLDSSSNNSIDDGKSELSENSKEIAEDVKSEYDYRHNESFDEHTCEKEIKVEDKDDDDCSSVYSYRSRSGDLMRRLLSKKINQNVPDSTTRSENSEENSSVHTLSTRKGISRTSSPALSMWRILKGIPSSKKPTFAELSVDRSYDVFVSSVVSPDLFYVQRDDYIEKLDDLGEDLKVQELHEVTSLVRVNQYYLAKFPPDFGYNRVQIRKIKESGEFVAFSVDVGDALTVTREDLRILEDRFIEYLPFQAIPCRLGGIVPFNGDKWSEEASKALWEMVCDQNDMNILITLRAVKECSSESQAEPRYEVILNEGGLILNEQLVKNDLAKKIENTRITYNTIKSDNASTAALIIWYDTNSEVILKVIVPGIDSSKYNLEVDEKHLHFSCLLNHKYFSNDLDLYSTVNSKHYHSVCETHVLIKLTKCSFEKWPRLTQQTTKLPFIKFDYDHIDLEDESGCESAVSLVSTVPTVSTITKKKGDFQRNFRIPELGETTESECDDDGDDFVGDEI